MAEKQGLKIYIDRIEDGVATLALYDDDRVQFNLPAEYLPEGATDGDYFRLLFRRDPASRAAEKQRADDLLKELLAGNSGQPGDQAAEEAAPEKAPEEAPEESGEDEGKER